MTQAAVDSLALVRFDRNSYSVPTKYAHRKVTVVATIDQIRLIFQDKLIARHDRCWDKEQFFYQPVHYLALLERKPGGFDFAKPVQEWPLPECFGLLRRRLEGADVKHVTRDYIRVLTLLERYSVRQLTDAIEYALDIGANGPASIRVIIAHRGERPAELFSLNGGPQLKTFHVEPTDVFGLPSVVECTLTTFTPLLIRDFTMNTKRQTKDTVLIKHHLKQLRLPPMLGECESLAAQAARDNQDHLAYLLKLCEREMIERERKSAERRLKAARFPAHKTLDQFDFKVQPSLNKPLIVQLAAGDYLTDRENILLVGPSGTGKSHLAIALAINACSQGKRVRFWRVTELITHVLEAKEERHLLRTRNQLAKLDLVVLDELGYVPASKAGAELLFDVIASAYERNSIIVTTNLPFENWPEVLGNQRQVTEVAGDR